MHQVIIHWDNQEPQILSADTKQELYKMLEELNINPEEALWEFKWVPGKAVVSDNLIKNGLGNHKEE